MNVGKLSFDNNPNIGLYFRVSDKYCLVGKKLNKNELILVSETFGVPVIYAPVYESELTGLFCVGNSSKLLVSDIVDEEEFRNLERELGKSGVKVGRISTRLTALGNNICVNDRICVISGEFSKKEEEFISNFFGVETHRRNFGAISVPGSMFLLTNKGVCFHPELEGDEFLKVFGKKFSFGAGTCNFGNPYVSSGAVANSFGLLIGHMTTGIEVQRIQEALGDFLY